MKPSLRSKSSVHKHNFMTLYSLLNFSHRNRRVTGFLYVCSFIFSQNLVADCVIALYCMCLRDLKPDCVCLERREGVAGGFQLLSLGHHNSVFGHHHSRIKIYTQQGEIKTFKPGTAGKMYLLPLSRIVQIPYS